MPTDDYFEIQRLKAEVGSLKYKLDKMRQEVEWYAKKAKDQKE